MAKGRFKKRPTNYRTQRGGPNTHQQNYIEKVTQPRTPEDLMLALQDPSTPAYKQMMNLLIDRMETNAIIEFLIHRYLIEQFEAKQKEKDDIYKELLARDLHDQKQIRPTAVTSDLASNTSYIEKEKLRDRIEARQEVIAELKNDIADLNNHVAELDKKAVVNDTTWRDTKKRHRQEFIKRLYDVEGIKYVSASGKEIDKEDPRFEALTKPREEADISKVVDVVALSHVLHQSKLVEASRTKERHPDSFDHVVKEGTDQASAGVVPPPPLPPLSTAKEIKKHMVNMSSLLQQLQDMADCRDTDSALDSLKAIKANQKGVNRVVAKEMQERTADKEEQLAILDNAFAIRDEKIEAIGKITMKQIELNREEMIDAAERKTFKDRFGEEFTPKSQAKMEAATPSQQSIKIVIPK